MKFLQCALTSFVMRAQDFIPVLSCQNSAQILKSHVVKLPMSEGICASGAACEPKVNGGAAQSNRMSEKKMDSSDVHVELRHLIWEDAHPRTIRLPIPPVALFRMQDKQKPGFPELIPVQKPPPQLGSLWIHL
ncbi:hypothetical protein E5288_WYG008925 [Bos mutus]|uniref:Uncharacterized protein n=1 Tax=Bos mutus TaxID=72004 RepID=A0A6B0QUH6_9CETA|nr:hypothetical protein [Bos mutus]